LLFAVGAVVVGEWRQFMSTATSERSQVTIRLDAVARARLEREAAQDRRPVSSLARLLIVDALADRERQGERVPNR
jgi:CopG-like RHH_1 or ribbon-helix-helix domain, RHH_5